jgi:hypothetical protein
MLKIINLGGFVVTTCLSDLEFAVTHGALLASWVVLKNCGPGDHVPFFDRKIASKKGLVGF